MEKYQYFATNIFSSEKCNYFGWFWPKNWKGWSDNVETFHKEKSGVFERIPKKRKFYPGSLNCEKTNKYFPLFSKQESQINLKFADFIRSLSYVLYIMRLGHGVHRRASQERKRFMPLYIERAEIWSRVTDPWQTHTQTTGYCATQLA